MMAGQSPVLFVSEDRHVRWLTIAIGIVAALAAAGVALVAGRYASGTRRP